MNRYAQVLTASALAYTAQASAAAKWARETTMSSPPQFIATAEQLVVQTDESVAISARISAPKTRRFR